MWVKAGRTGGLARSVAQEAQGRPPTDAEPARGGLRQQRARSYGRCIQAIMCHLRAGRRKLWRAQQTRYCSPLGGVM